MVIRIMLSGEVSEETQVSYTYLPIFKHFYKKYIEYIFYI